MTVETNDAPGAVIRRINMNIEAFLVSSSMVGAMAQRLVRCICEECKEPYAIDDRLRQRLMAAGIVLPPQLWHGKGCAKCRDTGYWGRIAVFEVMTVTPELADLIAAGVSTDAVRVQARKDGMISMLEDGIEKAGRGVTTLEEVLRIAVLENIADMPLPVVPHLEEKPDAKAAKETKPVVKTAESLSLDLDDYRKQMTSWLAQKKS